MKKSTALKILCAIALVMALIASVRTIAAARSYVECASRIVSGAPPTDSSPPMTFRRLSSAFWGHRDLFLARELERECAAEARGNVRRWSRQLFVLSIVKAQLSLSQRETLGAVLLAAPDGRGLTHVAQTEWGRPPADLDESEMTWLFVVGQRPSCSHRRALSEQDRQACAQLHQTLLAEIPRLPSPAPPTGRPP